MRGRSFLGTIAGDGRPLLPAASGSLVFAGGSQSALMSFCPGIRDETTQDLSLAAAPERRHSAVHTGRRIANLDS